VVRITCMRCSRSFTLTNEQIARIVEESRDTKHKHYVVNCPYCRQPSKAPLAQVRQAYARLQAMTAPAAGEAPVEEPAAETTPPSETPAADETSAT
jgi:DNA-directed RNA polymerase subunit RPC12/RpoP